MGFFADLFAIDSLIVFWGALFAHFLTENVFIPFIVSPNRFYAKGMGLIETPWKPIGSGKKMIFTVIILYYFIKYISAFALQMYTLRKCNKKNYTVSKSYGSMPALFGLLIYALMYAFPIFKVPMLMFKQYIPFIQNLLYGIPMAFGVSFGYYMQKDSIRNSVC